MTSNLSLLCQVESGHSAIQCTHKVRDISISLLSLLRGFFHAIPICIELSSSLNVHKFNYFVLLFFVERVEKVSHFDAVLIAIAIILQGMTLFSYLVLRDNRGLMR